MFHRWQSSLNIFPLGYHSGCPVFPTCSTRGEHGNRERRTSVGNQNLPPKGGNLWGESSPKWRETKGTINTNGINIIVNHNNSCYNIKRQQRWQFFFTFETVSHYHTITTCLYFALVLATSSYIVHVSWARMPRLARIFAPVRMYRNATTLACKAKSCDGMPCLLQCNSTLQWVLMLGNVAQLDHARLYTKREPTDASVVLQAWEEHGRTLASRYLGRNWMTCLCNKLPREAE